MYFALPIVLMCCITVVTEMIIVGIQHNVMRMNLVYLIFFQNLTVTSPVRYSSADRDQCIRSSWPILNKKFQKLGPKMFKML